MADDPSRKALRHKNPPAPRRIPVPPPPLWRDVLSADPTEHAFLVAIRATPDDAATRSVYADWLEQKGDARAALVRDRKAPACGDIEWRRLAASVQVECGRTNCWGRWDTFEAIDGDEHQRRCQSCELDVRYCATRLDVEVAAWTEAPRVIDPGADRDELQSWYELAQLDRARTR